MPNININRRVILSGSILQPETTAWLSVLPTRPSNSVISAVNNFIIQCKSDGNWVLLDRFWLFAQDNQNNAKISIVNPTSTAITEVSSPTWTSLQGYTGNGSTMYLNTNFNLSTATNFTQNSASIGFYSRTNTGNVTEVDIGAVSNTGTGAGTFANIKSGTGTYNWNLNSASAVVGAANADSRGLFQLNRTASNSQTSYRNGTSNSTNANASTAAVNLNCYVLCWNGNGTAGNFSTRQISMAFVGGNINASTFYTAFQNLIAIPLGFNV